MSTRALRILAAAACLAALACNLDVSIAGQSIGTFPLTLGTAPAFDVCNF